MPGFLNGVNSWSYAVNNSGQAVGYSAGSYPFFYDGSTTTEIPGLGTQGNSANAYALNNNGIVVGGSLQGGPDPTQHPFIWTRALGTQPLFSPIDSSGNAYGINDAGDVVGAALMRQRLVCFYRHAKFRPHVYHPALSRQRHWEYCPGHQRSRPGRRLVDHR